MLVFKGFRYSQGEFANYEQRVVVNVCTTSLTFSNSTFCPHSVLMCFVWIWEQTAIISIYSINWFVCITETECLLRGTDWVFIYKSGRVKWITSYDGPRHLRQQASGVKSRTSAERRRTVSASSAFLRVYHEVTCVLSLQFYQSALTQRTERLYLSLASPILGIKCGSLKPNSAVGLPWIVLTMAAVFNNKRSICQITAYRRQGSEQASPWEGNRCARTTKRFYPFKKTPTVSEARNVLPTE